ncbi:hypothetical protein BaRGS_00001173 [Batillaria attramentaria]|uniref:Sorting nexin-16 n=1 Tax=Batillaria attramentaria TaxID=370345 RepID=A0ABD0M6Y0_9CAEN
MENLQLPKNVSADKSSTDEANAVRGERASSDPKPITGKKPLKINYLPGGQSASFVSQRSSSFESAGSLLGSDEEQSESDSNTQPFSRTGTDDSKFQSSDDPLGPVLDFSSETKTAENDKTASSSDGKDAEDSHQWSCADETLPSSMLNPAHQSTPIHNYRSLSTVAEEGSNIFGTSTGHAVGDDGDHQTDQDVFMPGDLHTPILGFETMEARSRFTVFKIQVQKRADPTCWFVFRRYSDFLHLNERLKFMFPGFRLALPPKRWFRDNFDKDFLEDRILGLQAFLDNITGHKGICNSAPVRDFLCVDEPPGPHDSLEESRALCDTLEESVYALRQELQEKDDEVNLLKEELELYKSQVELLSSRLRPIIKLCGSEEFLDSLRELVSLPAIKLILSSSAHLYEILSSTHPKPRMTLTLPIERASYQVSRRRVIVGNARVLTGSSEKGQRPLAVILVVDNNAAEALT